MSQQLKHKIEANDTSISKLLKEQKFYIDYFKREYVALTNILKL